MKDALPSDSAIAPAPFLSARGLTKRFGEKAVWNLMIYLTKKTLNKQKIIYLILKKMKKILKIQIMRKKSEKKLMQNIVMMI